MTMDRCRESKGLVFGRCTLENVHAGDHDNGKTTWPRTGADLEIYLRTLEKIEEINQRNAYLQGLAEQHEQRGRRQ
jgi:hypothetical protein